jgi:hypothetical protein
MTDELETLRRDAARLRRVASLKTTGSYRADLVLEEMARRIEERVEVLAFAGQKPRRIDAS